MGTEAFAEYQRAIRDPATVRAMLEDYRAGLGIDRKHDEADQARHHRVSCPLLVLWSHHDDLELLYGDPLRIWESWAVDLRGGHSIDSGHHIAASQARYRGAWQDRIPAVRRTQAADRRIRGGGRIGAAFERIFES